ncbi:MAG: hypothetical protein JNL92_14080 [Opitutaceae bacterium]|nr:hypothetical protein [Opitutaceae bacterium]
MTSHPLGFRGLSWLTVLSSLVACAPASATVAAEGTITRRLAGHLATAGPHGANPTERSGATADE